MSELRVYEAARKLNVSVDEMISLLAGKGVEVKSPISVITQEQFDEVLNSYLREPQPQPARIMEPQAETESASAPVEKERARLALVTPISSRQTQETPQSQVVHETDEDEDEAPAVKEEVPSVERTAFSPAREAAPRVEASGGSTSNLTLTAVGLSIVAIIAVITLAVAAVRNSNEVSALSSSVQANQSMLNDTRNALNDLKAQVEINRKLDVRAGLAQRSATLEEISGSIPGPNGEKLRSIASKINALAAGL